MAPRPAAGAFRDGGNAKAPQQRARPYRVETDPRVAPADSCVVCGGTRGAIQVAHADPFCSRPCCESYYQGEG